jgi:hypothetical protein
MSNEHDDFNPVFHEGKTVVEHKQLGIAGDEHPLGTEPLSFSGDMRHLIRKVADDLYESWESTIREYLANAETACLRVEEFIEDDAPETFNVDSLYGIDDGYEPRIEVTWDRADNTLTIRDNGVGMAAAEIDHIFRRIGSSVARDSGQYSGQFGMGALSFVKLIGIDNSMVMTTHSRQTDENFSTYVSLAGPEPIIGKMPDDQYGTSFQMTPKDTFDIRGAVETYSQWMRVPVIYREYDESGEEVFNEDWGDAHLTDDYAEATAKYSMSIDGAFEAHCSIDAEDTTLLLSMPIDRNDRNPTSKAPFPYDIRLLDESGKVIVSDNGHEGKMPCPRSDYEQMLLDARSGVIIEDMLSNNDIIGQYVDEGPHAGDIAVDDKILTDSTPLPPHTYVAKSDLHGDDIPGDVVVLIGPHKGRVVIDDGAWDSMDAGRAARYVPEDELEPFDPHEETGDLTLPEPTSDRDRLQQNDVFWTWLGSKLKMMFEQHVARVMHEINESEDPVEELKHIDIESMIVDIQEAVR